MQGTAAVFRKRHTGSHIAAIGDQMGILKRFYPDYDLGSAYDMDYESLYREGFRGIIFDIDNTLVPHGAPSDERSRELFCRLRGIGYDCVLLSNNKEERVKLFNDPVGAKYIYKAHKPSPENYRRAMELMGTDPTNTFFVGDQLFTDVWGANRAGIRTYLVKPIHPREEIQIVFKRQLERIVLFFYHRYKRKNGKISWRPGEGRPADGEEDVNDVWSG